MKFVKNFLWGGGGGKGGEEGQGTPVNGLNYVEDQGLRLKGVLFSGFRISNGREFTN